MPMRRKEKRKKELAMVCLIIKNFRYYSITTTAIKPRFIKEPVYVVSTKMIDEGKVHAKTKDPHENVGKLEKDGDKAMNEEIERKTVKKIAHESKGWQNLCPNKPKAMKISKEGRNGTRRLKKTKIYRVPKEEHDTVLSMPTGIVEESKGYICPAFHQCDFGDNHAPNKEAVSKKGKREDRALWN
ncbi:hypothetical protein Tco_1266507 [Tanacetum coccineum]